MLCIFCRTEQDSSLEHIFPLAIGGAVTIDRVCPACNSVLGSRVDSALSDFFPIRMRRAKLNLAGNSGISPSWHEMFVGEATLIGREANRVLTTFNKTTKKLETRQLYHAADVTMPDGTKARQITIDAKDKADIPKILQRERKRHGLAPLTAERLTEEVQKFTVTSIDKPLIQMKRSISFEFLNHAMAKIAYELAFLWLGETYLEDPQAKKLSKAILDKTQASISDVEGYFGFTKDEAGAVFKTWTPHEAHHLAFASVASKQIFIAVRIFDIYAGAIVVSHHPERYLKTATDENRLRFIAIDSVTGKTSDTTYNQEARRIAIAMTKYRRSPPFEDPLSIVAIDEENS